MHHHSRAAFLCLLLQCLLAGCASGPRGSYFDAAASTANVVILPAERSPKIAVIGLVVQENEDPSRHDRLVQTDRGSLSPLLAPVLDGLRANATRVNFTVVDDAFDQIDCALPDAKTTTDPRDAPCKFPSQLASDANLTAMGHRNFTHVLVVVAWNYKSTGKKRATWGIGPGIPAVTAETAFNVYVKVVARLYEIASGAQLTEASAVDGGSGSHGVMLSLLPFYVGPSQATLLESTARAVGREVGRRLQMASTGKGTDAKAP